MERSELLVQPLLNAGVDRTSEELGCSCQRCSLPATGAPAIGAPATTRQNFNDTRRANGTGSAAQPEVLPLMVVARIGLGWKRCLQVVNGMFGAGAGQQRPADTSVHS